MATVTGLTAERMLEIEAASVVSGAVSGDELILTKHDGSTIDAGNVRGPQGPVGYDTAPIGSIITHTSQVIPAEYLLANGQSVSEDNYPQLAAFAAAEVTAGNPLWGISGSSPHRTIVVPDLRDRFLFSTGAKTFGSKAGEELHVLLAAESGVNGSGQASNHGTGISINNGGDHAHNIHGQALNTAVVGNWPGLIGYDDNGHQFDGNKGTDNAGTHSHGVTDPGHIHIFTPRNADSAHNNMPPYCVLAFLVKAKGISISSGVATGPPGPQGPAGTNGVDGAPGAAGPQGPAGLSGGIYSDIWSWTTNTASAASSGQVGVNAAGWAAVTQININEQTKDGRNVSVLAFPRFAIGDTLYLQHKTDPTRNAYYTISGAPVDNGTWWSIPVNFSSGNGTVPGGTTDTNVTLFKAGASTVPVQDEGTTLTARSKINFIGTGVAAVDDPANDRTNVTVAGSDITSLSASAPDKIAWEYPSGTDVVELYGLDTAAGLVAVANDNFNTNTLSNYTQESAWTWSGSDISIFNSTSRLVNNAFAAVGDTARVTVRAKASGTGSGQIIGVGFTVGTDYTKALGFYIAYDNHIWLAHGDVISGTAPTHVEDLGLAGSFAMVANTYYTLRYTRQANNYLIEIFDSAGTTLLGSKSGTMVGSAQATYGAGVSLRPGWMLSIGGGWNRTITYDDLLVENTVPEARDLLLAVTPVGGSRTVKRIFGSSGSSTFRSDFVQPADVLPGVLSGVATSPNTQTANYTLALTDAGKSVEMNSASATTVTVPPNSSVAFPIGTMIEVARYGAGTVAIAAGAGVTIRSRGALLSIGNQYGAVSLRKRATDEWVLVGDLA